MNWHNKEFHKILCDCFKNELPGLESHLLLAPEARRDDMSNYSKHKTAVKSSVLLLFYKKRKEPYVGNKLTIEKGCNSRHKWDYTNELNRLLSEEYYLVFIKRPVYNGVHSGQISFPGGKWETTDKSLYHTALREAREEIGIHPERVTFIGKLTDLYIPPSNYVVSPFVGTYSGNCNFFPNPKEVESIIEIPASFLLHENDPPFQSMNISLYDGSRLNVPGICFHKNIIWGATAMILNEFFLLWKSTVNNRCFER